MVHYKMSVCSYSVLIILTLHFLSSFDHIVGHSHTTKAYNLLPSSQLAKQNLMICTPPAMKTAQGRRPGQVPVPGPCRH